MRCPLTKKPCDQVCGQACEKSRAKALEAIRSGAAERQRKRRARLRTEGFRILTIELPAEAAGHLATLCADRPGSAAEHVIAEALAHYRDVCDRPAPRRHG